MFAPEKYLPLRHLCGLLDPWVDRIICAYVLEEIGEDPSRAFLERVDPESLILHLENWRAVGIDIPEAEASRRERRTPESDEKLFLGNQERGFENAILMNMLLAKILKDSTPLMCSKDGSVLRLTEPLALHMDRLDWCDLSWPLRDSAYFTGYYQEFDEGKFDVDDLNDRFCFIDRFTGLVAMKNNSMNGYATACHLRLKAEKLNRVENSLVRPFIDWAIAWNPDELPDTIFEIFDHYGWIKDRWTVEPGLSEFGDDKRMGKRGRKPTGAQKEYFRRYPDGKPADLSYDAISAELTEAVSVVRVFRTFWTVL